MGVTQRLRRRYWPPLDWSEHLVRGGALEVTRLPTANRNGATGLSVLYYYEKNEMNL